NIELLFTGEGDMWKAELTVVRDGDREKREFKLIYTGDEDYKSIEDLSYEVQGPEDFSVEGAKVNAMKYTVDKEKSKDLVYTTGEESEIEVTVDLAGESETFQLTQE